MKKRIFIILLTLCLAITAMTVVACAGEYISGDDFVCQINDAYTKVTITGYEGLSDNITIPSQVEGMDVVAIADDAFAYTSIITSVSIPDTVESIGKRAFAFCNNLTSVTLSEGLKSIGANAFDNCYQLSSITIPSSVTRIETHAFTATAITSVTLSCGTIYATDSFPDNCTITISDHNYVNGVCSVCGNEDSDYVIVGSAELHDGYYTVDGVSAVYGTPDSTVTSYARYSNGTLYLSNFTYTATSGNCIVFSNDSLTIDLCNSSSTISGTIYGIDVVGDLTVTNGSLVVSAEYGIAVTNGDVLISDCTSVTVLATDGYGIVARNYSDSDHSVTISDSTVNVTATTTNGGSMAGIVATGDVNISGSTVSVTVDCEDVIGAIWSMGGNISITDESTVTAVVNAATYSSGAISTMWSETGNITISKSEVTASSECTSSTAINYGAICAEGDISITDSTVTAEAISTIVSGGAITSFGDSGSITISESTVKASSVCTSITDETINYGAIYAVGDISITESEVTASTNSGLFYDLVQYGAAICSEKESILISGSNINVTVDSSSNYYAVNNYYDTAVAIFSFKDVVISDESEVTVNTVAVFNSFGIFAIGNSTISESAVSVETEGAVTYGIWISNSLVIEDCDNVSVIVYGNIFAAGICGDSTITGSSVNVKASATDSSGTVYGIWSANSATITASEIAVDGGIYVDSSTGTVTVTPATGGSMKITKTDASATDISTIDEATVIDTSGYTYVAITEHVHTYDASGVAWTWTDYETVTAVATCTDEDCTYQVTATATVESKTDDATCTVDGKTVYTATATIDGTVYTDTQTVVLPAIGHDYGFTEFTWAEDLLSAKAVYTCANCGESYTVDATITMQGSSGVYTITATVTDSDGTVHADTQVAGINLTTIAADYTAVNDAIAKANSLVASNYTNFDTVTNAINKVQWNLSVVNQGTVNNYAEAIETAIANLIPVSSTTEETVDIDEPIEDTDTQVEPDEEEEPIETPVDENPTTGIALALLPMAIAMAGVVSRKRG